MLFIKVLSFLFPEYIMIFFFVVLHVIIIFVSGYDTCNHKPMHLGSMSLAPVPRSSAAAHR